MVFVEETKFTKITGLKKAASNEEEAAPKAEVNKLNEVKY